MPSAPEYFRERRAQRLAEGLCVVCGLEPVKPGRTRGAECAERERKRTADRRLEAAARGVCEACMRRKRKPGRGRRCDSCANKYLPAQLERDRKRRAHA